MDPELIEYLDRRFTESAAQVREVVDQSAKELDRSFRQVVDQRALELDQSLREVIDQRAQVLDQSLREVVDQRAQVLDQSLREVVDHRVREVGVLIEELDSKIRLVADGVVANGEAHRSLRLELDRQFEEVKAVNRLSYIELDRRYGDHERRITELERG